MTSLSDATRALVVFSLLSLGQAAAAETIAEEVTRVEPAYAVSAPGEWQQIPEATVQAALERSPESLPFEAYYKLANSPFDFDYPLVMIRTVTYAEAGLPRQPYVAELADAAQQILGGAGNSIQVDALRRRFTAESQRSVDGLGAVHQHYCGHFGVDRCVVIQFTGISEHWGDTATDRNRWQEAVKLSAATAYDVNRAYPPPDMKSLAIGGAAVLGLALMAAIFQRLRPKSKPAAEPAVDDALPPADETVSREADSSASDDEPLPLADDEELEETVSSSSSATTRRRG